MGSDEKMEIIDVSISEGGPEPIKRSGVRAVPAEEMQQNLLRQAHRILELENQNHDFLVRATKAEAACEGLGKQLRELRFGRSEKQLRSLNERVRFRTMERDQMRSQRDAERRHGQQLQAEADRRLREINAAVKVQIDLRAELYQAQAEVMALRKKLPPVPSSEPASPPDLAAHDDGIPY